MLKVTFKLFKPWLKSSICVNGGKIISVVKKNASYSPHFKVREVIQFRVADVK
jgi:hypothetical protein